MIQYFFLFWSLKALILKQEVVWLKRLLVLRHGERNLINSDSDDINTGMTNLGKEQITGIGNYLLRNNLIPDIIITSSSIRTIQASSIIKTITRFHSEVIIEDALFEYDAESNFSVLHKLKHHNLPLIVSHNTTLEALTGKESSEFFPGILVIISFDIEKWEDINDPGEVLKFVLVKPKFTY